LKEIALSYKNVVLGLTNPELLSQLRVYPNPVNGNELRIELRHVTAEPVLLKLYNSEGQLIYSGSTSIQLSGDIKLPLTGLQSGTYFLSIYQGKKVDTIKFLKR
jgi:hypothetical protein